MRQINNTIDLPENLPDWPQTEVTTYHCTLVTPMYGGGVRAGEVDTEMPIRASEIRGQLRFWWRITCGHSLPSREMFQRETAIWGGIADTAPTASKVWVHVKCLPVKKTDLCLSSSETDLGIKYAFGPATINGDANWLAPNYNFDLTFRYSNDLAENLRNEANAALRWWASFGGLGARTRRGFGSIQVANLDPITSTDVGVVNGILRFSGMGGRDPKKEWKNAITKLFEFRQKRGIGRRQGNQRPGRSYWPEPDQLRRFSGKNAKGEHEAGNVFPRAAFGLPITFDFNNPTEPPKLELLPQGGKELMASPLILRPYWTGKTWKAAALLLPGWREALSQPLTLKDSRYQPAHWPTDPNERYRIATQIRPMVRNGILRGDDPNNPDPLSAFMHYFEHG